MQSRQVVLTMLGLLYAILAAGCVQEPPPAPAVTAGSSSRTAARDVPSRFDGTWQVAAAGIAVNPGEEASFGCGSINVQFQVRNSEIVGGVRKTPEGASADSNQEYASAPMSGTVEPDGTVNMFWERYVVTGKMIGDQVQLQWKGECGPRLATGGRVTS